jgi:hypothetical protein
VSIYDYRRSQELVRKEYPFYALIMAAMRGADTANAARLGRAFPETWKELKARYHAPGGILPGEETPHEATND